MSTSDAMRIARGALERAQDATEGPWHRHDFGHATEEEPSSIVIHTGPFNWADLNAVDGHSESAVAWMPSWDSQEDRNAVFIAESRQDVPRLAAFALAVLAACEDYDRWSMLTLNEREPALMVSQIKGMAQRYIVEQEPLMEGTDG